MLVYANRLQLQGVDSEKVAFRAIGGWLKEQLGFGLHPDQLLRNGEHRGQRGELPSRLRIYSCYDGEPALCAWVLKHGDADVRGRQWTVEVGVKKSPGTLEVSCVVKADERSTLVSSPVSASQPRLIRYIHTNILSAKWDAEFAATVPGMIVRTIGQDRDSYRAFLFEIQRHNRDAAIVLISPTREGEYLIHPTALQRILIGLANVVQVLPGSNTYEMEEVLGRPRSAWNGAVNVLSIPSQSGDVRFRLFLCDEIRAWGEGPQRTSQVLAWVTGNTNIPRLRQHVRPEGVMLLSTRRRMEKIRATAVNMEVAELRQELIEASQQADDQERVFEGFAEENLSLYNELSRFKDEYRDTQDELRRKKFDLNSLKDQLSAVGADKSIDFDPESFLQLIARKEEPSPLKCIEIIEQFYGDKCIVLDSAQRSASKSQFISGRGLLDLLLRLVTTYRDRLLDGGDNKARRVFGRNEYAAKESETVMANKAMRRQRIFDYDGVQVEMFRHLKVGVANDPTQTIRVHFHWDGARQKIVIGYCGEHLPVSSH